MPIALAFNLRTPVSRILSLKTLLHCLLSRLPVKYPTIDPLQEVAFIGDPVSFRVNHLSENLKAIRTTTFLCTILIEIFPFIEETNSKKVTSAESVNAKLVHKTTSPVPRCLCAGDSISPWSPQRIF